MYGLLLASQFILFFTIAHGFEVPEEMKEVVDSLHNTCVSETSVSEDLILKARTGDFVDDQALKCYIKCLFDNMGCLTDEGKIDVEAVLAIFPPDLAAKVSGVIRKCDTVMGADVCDNVFLTNKCYYNGNPDMYFLP